MTDVGSTTGLTVVHGAAEPVIGFDKGTGVVVLEDAAFATLDDEVVAVGPTTEVLADYPVEDAETAIDATNKTVLLGSVDPHTHAFLTDDHPGELVVKLQGAIYGDILADGGGILCTVDTVCGVPDDELAATLVDHPDAMLIRGMTMAEVKIGYGLDTEAELRILSAINMADLDHLVDVILTFMGTHVVLRGVDAEEYTKSVASNQLPVVAAQDIAEFCGVLCEHGVFTAEQSRRILDVGRDHGLMPKTHTDEFAAIGGIDVAVSIGTASADHLLHTDDEGRDTLVDAGVTLVLFPGAAFGPGAGYADARVFLDAGHEVAFAIDSDPNCFVRSMSFVATPASVGMRMTPHEVTRGVTSAAAGAFDRDDGTDVLRTRIPADAIVLDVPTALHLSYRLDTNPISTALKSGVVAHEWLRMPPRLGRPRR